MRVSRLLILWFVSVVAVAVSARSSAQSSSAKNSRPPVPAGAASGIEPGVVVNDVYRNKSVGLTCKIPAGWVLRTEEMNSSGESSQNPCGENAPFSQNQGDPSTSSRAGAGHSTQESSSQERSSVQGAQSRTEESRVLLAAFSRPPEERGEDVNASIVIAAESVASYPGMTDAAQYFAPVTEVAQSQGFTVDEEPYEFAIGAKKVVRGDFHKDVGTRVMRQSTLAFLARGYAVSITVIGGTEDEVEDLIDGVAFAAGR
jgi:hypothetical protein